MPSSWSTYSTLRPRFLRAWRLPALRLVNVARMVSPRRLSAHMLFIVLVSIFVWQPSVSLLPERPQAVEHVVADEPRPASVSGDQEARLATTPQRRYLARSAVPYTIRSLKAALPLSEPQQREVRTDVFTYKVQAGDTVLGIAQKFDLKGTSLLWANEDLAANPDFLHIGQSLFVLPIDGAYHTVAKGESIEQIAKKYRVEPSAITSYAANALDEPYALEAGQRLIIPGGIMPAVVRQVFAYQGSSPPENASVGSGSFGWPTTGFISQRYWEGHRAIDIANRARPPVVATDSGFVSYMQNSTSGYGRMLIIDHGNGFQTLYGHLDAVYVKVGESVAKGQTIGKVGSTGNSTGPHLHFEIIKSSVRRNPMIYLP